MFAGYRIESITNGVHASTWTSAPFAELYDRRIPGWRADNYSLRAALAIPDDEIWQAHQQAKQTLISYVNQFAARPFAPEVLTIGFARRATTYKRADLLLDDPATLRRIANRAGPLQLVFAGKAHPADNEGKAMIQRLVQSAQELLPDVPIVYLPNYDMHLGRILTAGSDIWLNTPQRPLEASGTSGMKAALNGVPSLSILDGWWIEGCIEGITGWAVGYEKGPSNRADDAESLYDKLEHVVVPMYYHQRLRLIEMMRHVIALNGSFFTTQRMIQQYSQKAYM
jgi:starch phosphorylase